MSYEITISDVTAGFSTPACSEVDISNYIVVLDQADACLTANGVPAAIGRQLKILGVRHLTTNATGGTVVEERSISGASRKFAERSSGQTSYLDTLRTIDTYVCVMSVLSSASGPVQLRSIGRRSPT